VGASQRWKPLEKGKALEGGERGVAGKHKGQRGEGALRFYYYEVEGKNEEEGTEKNSAARDEGAAS